MPGKCEWIEINKNQIMYSACDNSLLEHLADHVRIDEIRFPNDNDVFNLGIRRNNEQVFSSNYVGICRLEKLGGGYVRTSDTNQEVILKIEPRFNISVVEMLNVIKDDDEFDRYLAPQTVAVDTAEKSIEELERNEVFHFFDEEDPIHVSDNIARDSSIITATVFISMLRDLCRRPLMGRMLNKEENLVGKVKGKIVFSSNLKKNTTRGRDDRIYCKYLQYSENIIENQILKAALLKASQYLNKYFKGASAKSNYGEMVSFCKKALEHVEKKRITSKDIVGIKTTGCYAYYKPVISVSKMILNEITIESNGDTKTTSYVVPYAISMSKLFEMYCRALLKKSGVKSYLQPEAGIHIEKYDLKTKVFERNTRTSANYISGILKPDIILRDDETNEKIIFDVKYKRLSQRRNARNDRLQLLAYGLMYNCSDIGIIFPAEAKLDENGDEDSKSYFYDKHEIDSEEDQTRFYHQIELYIGTNTETVLYSKNTSCEMRMMEYVRRIYEYKKKGSEEV